MKLVFLFSLLLAVQLCSSQRTSNRLLDNRPLINQPVTNQPTVEQCNIPRPDDHNRYDNRFLNGRYNYPTVRDYSQYEYFNTCKEILEKFPDTPSGFYYIIAGPDSYRKVYCEMEKKICGEKGWEKFYYLNLVENPTQDCPTNFVKKSYSTPSFDEQPFCEKTTIGNNKCTKTTFSLQEKEYYEVCAKVSGYQYGTPTAFKPYDVEYSKFYLDGIQFTHGKEKRHLWSYVIGTSKTYNKDMMNLRDLCPTVSPNYNWNIPYYLGNNYYCDSGLYNFTSKVDTTTFHSENKLWEVQPWFYTKLPTSLEDYIEIQSCFIGNDADLKFNNLEIYLR